MRPDEESTEMTDYGSTYFVNHSAATRKPQPKPGASANSAMSAKQLHQKHHVVLLGGGQKGHLGVEY
jgi:hypothetical protein